MREKRRQMPTLLQRDCSSSYIQAWMCPKEFNDVAWPQLLVTIFWKLTAEAHNGLIDKMHVRRCLYQLLGKKSTPGLC